VKGVSVMDKINIALPSDENYVCGLTATAGSIAMYASRDVVLSFHVLDGGIRDDTFAAFENVVRKWHPHCEFVRHAVDEAAFKDFPAWSGNRMTYARLLIPQFLPDEDFCIYSDTDMIWLRDISELWAQRDSGCVYKSARETYDCTLDAEEAWFRSHGMAFYREKYICAGLSFFNLKRMREKDVVERIAEFINAYPDLRMADQTALNAIYGKEIGILDSAWQRLTISRADGEPFEGKVVHYAGEIPWRRGLWNQMITDSIMVWHSVNGRIHGKSTWWSLRQHFSTTSIIGRRVLWHVMRSPVLRWGVRALLSTTGRGQYCPDMINWVHCGKVV